MIAVRIVNCFYTNAVSVLWPFIFLTSVSSASSAADATTGGFITPRILGKNTSLSCVALISLLRGSVRAVEWGAVVSGVAGGADLRGRLRRLAAPPLRRGLPAAAAASGPVLLAAKP